MAPPRRRTGQGLPPATLPRRLLHTLAPQCPHRALPLAGSLPGFLRTCFAVVLSDRGQDALHLSQPHAVAAANLIVVGLGL